MKTLLLGFALTFFAAIPATADDAASPDLAAEVRELRAAIKELRAETKSLADTIKLLRNQLLAEAANPEDEPLANASPCEQRLYALERKADTLMSLGYLDTHPDVRTVKGQIMTLKHECNTEG